MFEVRAHAQTYRDVSFDAEVVTQFRTSDLLADLDVRALVVSDARVWAGTSSGLFVLDSNGSRFDRVALAGTSTAVVDLAPIPGGGVLVATRHSVVRVGADGSERSVLSLAPRVITAVEHSDPNTDPGGEAAYVGTAHAVLYAGPAGTSTVGGVAGAAVGSVRDLALTSAGMLWIAASSGVYRYDSASPSSPLSLAPFAAAADPRALALALADGADADARDVWIASASALLRTSDGTVLRPEKGGLPTDDLRALAVAGDEVLIGHGIGASAISVDAGARIEHYHSLRWLPAEEVRAVAIGPGKMRWIATSAGISRIAYAPTTLRAKADAFESTFPTDHTRMDGFVADYVGFADAYDHSAGPSYSDNDNDGLWTEMQIGTWCLAYAVTGDEAYRSSARRALDVMYLQIDVPAAAFTALGMTPGFISKSLVRDDEAAFDAKKDDPAWRTQEFGGRTYRWKIFTSSDEYAGHYFGMPLYYDLCAKDEAEKQELRDHLKLATDYLIAAKYIAKDIAGEVHDRWDNVAASADGIDGCPERFDLATCLNSFGGGGWLNSTELLGMLLATWHVTGDNAYYDEYERLYTVEKHGKMVPLTDNTLTVTSPAIANHSDHELAMLAFFTMLRYEPNEARRAIAVKSLLDFYGYEKREHNPWQVATIAMYHAGDVDLDLDGAITSLRDIPLDRRNWLIDNSHRKDAGHWPNDRGGVPQFDTAFPYDEINCLKWNGGPYTVRDGWTGEHQISPTPYLIAYWMLRYTGLIE